MANLRTVHVDAHRRLRVIPAWGRHRTRTVALNVVPERTWTIVPNWFPYNAGSPGPSELEALPGQFDVFFNGWANSTGFPTHGCCNNFIQYDWAMVIQLAPIPEPSTLALLAIGILGLIGHEWMYGRG